jgi:hypothetical protein
MSVHFAAPPCFTDDDARAWGFGTAQSSIILVFSGIDRDMEAERLNTLEASINDLRRRAVELRGYL